jgi:hypothetical protein
MVQYSTVVGRRFSTSTVVDRWFGIQLCWVDGSVFNCGG